MKICLPNIIIGKKRKMKMQKNKIAAIAIAILFILSMIVSTTIVPNTNAHTPPWTIPTTAYITVAPNTVGITRC